MNELDVINNSELTIEETSPFFGGEIVSELSVNLELPMTEKNLELLEIYSPIDVRKSIHSVTAIDSNISSTDATLHLDSVNFEEKKIAATLYINEEIAHLLNSPIREINPDDENSIIRWDCFSYKYPYNNENYLHLSDSRVRAYLTEIDKRFFPAIWAIRKADNMRYTGCTAFKEYQYHPSVRLQELFDRLVQYSDNVISFDGSRVANSEKLRVVAAHRNVCPQNNVQWLYCSSEDTKYNFSSTPRTDLPIIIAGQHITNDGEGEEVSDKSRVTFNRAGKVNIKRIATEIKTIGDAPGTISVVLRDDSSYEVATLVQVQCTDMPEHSNIIDVNSAATFGNGYSLAVELHGSRGTLNAKYLRVWLELEVTDYEVTSDDYSTELSYYSGIENYGFDCYDSSDDVNYNAQVANIFKPAYQAAFYREGGIAKWHGVVPCFSFFGIFSNLGELSFGDLLLNWMCQAGQLAIITPNSFKLVDAALSDNLITQLEKFTSGEIEILSDNLGTCNFITYANEKREQVVELRNDNLEKEKEVIALAVGLPEVYRSANDSLDYVACYPLYSGEATEDTDSFYPPDSVSYQDLPPFISYDYGDRLRFAFKHMKISNLFKQIDLPFVYNFEILQELHTPFVNIDGFIYWVISSVKDINNKFTTIKAIKL